MSLTAVVERMRGACLAGGRQLEEVTLVVVSKGRSTEDISQVYEQGHRDFGENRAQELAAKAPGLPADIRWHFVGPLQRNKVKLVRPVAYRLHSLDSVRLAQAWIKGVEVAPAAYLEVNLAAEPQKHGFSPAELEAVADKVLSMGVDVRGVMAIPPFGEEASPYFDRLVELQRQLVHQYPTIVEVSAGMTDDFEEAIRAGATTIRVGRAIFDERRLDE